MTGLEYATYDALHTILKNIQDEDNLTGNRAKGAAYLEDNSVIGNPDKMLFFAKELASCARNKQSSMNPFVMGKLDIEQVEHFNF